MGRVCHGVCNFPRVGNACEARVYCSTCAKLYHKNNAPKYRCPCCGTAVRLYRKRKVAGY